MIAQGPAASQIAIKQLGTNGGGFFNANSAHPYENPTPLSNLLEMVFILLIPAAFCFMFGRMVKDMRQGVAIFAAMVVLFVGALALTYGSEIGGNPELSALPIDQSAGNMEGKEVRFGVGNSALWATATTAASNGSVNAMHESFTPLGMLAPMLQIQTGEVVFGGVGSGFYGMLLFVVLTVFLAGLMVGRTPEYLGKKIEAKEVKLAILTFLVMPVGVLGFGALAAVLPVALASVQQAGRMASPRCSMPIPRRPATTAPLLPASTPIRPITTPCRASRCCSAATSSSCRCSQLPARSRPRRLRRRLPARSRLTRRCS